MTEIKLTDCKCGGLGKIQEVPFSEVDDRYVVECHSCMSRTPEYLNEAYASTAWNMMQTAFCLHEIHLQSIRKGI